MKNKVVVITGATSGIGRACAVRFAQEGARVVVSGRRREQGEAVAREIGAAATFVACDVTQADQLKALIDQSLARLGQIDCVINNAGAATATNGICETDPMAFDQDLALHLRAPFLTMKFAAPNMISRGSGCFINLSSISGSRAGFNPFGYEVAKAALTHLTRCAAIEFGEKGIRVNSISPGPTLTEIHAKHVGADMATVERMVEATFSRLLPSVQALPGVAHAEDIANAAIFLAGDDARYVNGHELVVDGGITAGRPYSTMKAGWAAIDRALGDIGR